MEIEAFPYTCFCHRKKRINVKKNKIKKKSIKQHVTKNVFCSRLNNVHGGLVVFHMSRVHL